MAVIVSYFYGAQTRHLRDGKAVRNAVTTASEFLRAGAYTNVIVEIANELNIGLFRDYHPLIYYPEGMAALLDLARDVSGLPVGCSGTGGYSDHEIGAASDVILVHGNGCSRQRYYNLIQTAKSWGLNRPIVCNEDSQAIGQLQVAFKTRTSWGYYNNMTKQEPPADWSITPGEDTFFAWRLAAGIGLAPAPLPFEEQYYLQGLEPQMTDHGQRWLRLASLYPETIDSVDYYLSGSLVYTAYDEPFSVNFHSNWRQGGWQTSEDDRQWKAVIHLRNGEIVERVKELT
jgi:hypothetical protein